MRIDPRIGALRGSDASRRAMQLHLEKARDSWLEGAATNVAGELAEYGAGRPFEECPQLASLFECPDTAMQLIDPLVGSMMAALAENVLGHVPLRHQSSDNLSIVELMKAGRAALTLISYDELDLDPASASFAAVEMHELVLAGAADLWLVRLLEDNGTRAALDIIQRRFVSGEKLHCTGGRSTRVVKKVHGRFVMLRLARTEVDPRETRQYALDDGRLLHRASGSREESRREMAMALLGRMGRTDVAPLLADLAREGIGHIRWQSLRECLALDSGIGFSALSRIAADPSDPLATPAGALRAQLVEDYPQLLEVETGSCRS